MAPSGPDLPGIPIERERERTIELLSRHFANDNLSLDELERRMDLVYRVTGVTQLRALVADLPAELEETAKRREVELPDAFAPEHGRIVSIMAETKRRGIWRPPRTLDVLAIMSDTRLDLTEAHLSAGVTEIHLRAVMATLRIIVPPGVRIVIQPSAFMSSVSDELIEQPAVGSAPVVRVTGFIVMGELKVVVRRRELAD